MLDTRVLQPSIVLALASWLAAGCIIPKPVGETPEDQDEASTGGGNDQPDASASATSTSGASGNSTATSDPSDSTGLEDDTGFAFIGPEDSAIHDPCDLWAQDCAAGLKCMPWANDGGDTWNSTHCTPVVPDPDVVGEACSVEGNGVSGHDTCAFGAMCWNADVTTDEGTCVAQCAGDPRQPACSDGTTCVIANDGALAVCVSSCDPMLLDCAANETCLPWEDAFVCLPAGCETPSDCRLPP